MKHNELKLNLKLAIALLLIGTNTAVAEQWGIGLSVTQAPINVENADTSFGGDADGWRAFGSYMFTRNIGIEAGMSKYGSPDDSSIPPNMHADTESWDVYAVYAYPLSNNFDVIAKAGYISWDTETEVDDTDEMHFKNDDFALSLGGEYDLGKNFGIRGELEWFDSMVSGELKYSLSAVLGFK